ncbi:transposase [bacterium]|nr:transposase [bacterium]
MGHVLAYLITMRGYGTWLHGDERGSVDSGHRGYGSAPVATDKSLELMEASLLKTQPITFDRPRRTAIATSLFEVCQHKGWTLLASNVRTNHVHVVVAAAEVTPEFVMNTFKSWATRAMVASGALPHGTKAWSRHGSTRYLWTERSVHDACVYVLEGQGPPLP